METGWLSLPADADGARARRDTLIRSVAKVRQMAAGMLAAEAVLATV